MMHHPLLVAVSIGLALGGTISWAVAARHGTRQALIIPVPAVLASLLVVWRSGGGSAALVLAIAAPVVAGALLALLIRALLASVRRGRANPEDRPGKLENTDDT